MDDRSFLELMAADPHDAATRLAFADWLEERGDSRAELVRILVRLAQITNQQPEYPDLKRREAELIEGCSPEWLASVRVPRTTVINWILHARLHDSGCGRSRYWPVLKETPKLVLVREIPWGIVYEPQLAQAVPAGLLRAEYLVTFREPRRPIEPHCGGEMRLGKRVVNGALCFQKGGNYYEIWNGRANYSYRHISDLES
jgi:uncharacterized protein (TIGR02996 family)